MSGNDYFISACKLFRATRSSRPGAKKHIEYKVTRRKDNEGVGLIYNMDIDGREQWVFDPLLTPLTPTQLIDLASLVTVIRLSIKPDPNDF